MEQGNSFEELLFKNIIIAYAKLGDENQMKNFGNKVVTLVDKINTLNSEGKSIDSDMKTLLKYLCNTGLEVFDHIIPFLQNQSSYLKSIEESDIVSRLQNIDPVPTAIKFTELETIQMDINSFKKLIEQCQETLKQLNSKK